MKVKLGRIILAAAAAAIAVALAGCPMSARPDRVGPDVTPPPPVVVTITGITPAGPLYLRAGVTQAFAVAVNPLGTALTWTFTGEYGSSRFAGNNLIVCADLPENATFTVQAGANGATSPAVTITVFDDPVAELREVVALASLLVGPDIGTGDWSTWSAANLLPGTPFGLDNGAVWVLPSSDRHVYLPRGAWWLVFDSVDGSHTRASEVLEQLHDAVEEARDIIAVADLGMGDMLPPQDILASINAVQGVITAHFNRFMYADSPVCGCGHCSGDATVDLSLLTVGEINAFLNTATGAEVNPRNIERAGHTASTTATDPFMLVATTPAIIAVCWCGDEWWHPVTGDFTADVECDYAGCECVAGCDCETPETTAAQCGLGSPWIAGGEGHCRCWMRNDGECGPECACLANPAILGNFVHIYAGTQQLLLQEDLWAVAALPDVLTDTFPDVGQQWDTAGAAAAPGAIAPRIAEGDDVTPFDPTSGPFADAGAAIGIRWVASPDGEGVSAHVFGVRPATAPHLPGVIDEGTELLEIDLWNFFGAGNAQPSLGDQIVIEMRVHGAALTGDPRFIRLLEGTTELARVDIPATAATPNTAAPTTAVTLTATLGRRNIPAATTNALTAANTSVPTTAAWNSNLSGMAADGDMVLVLEIETQRNAAGDARPPAVTDIFIDSITVTRNLP
jgi:hypothetical protein